MPQTPDFGRYLNAGAEFVAVTRAQARRRANDLVAQGQLAQDQVQAFVDGLVEESRRRTDVLAGIVRQEIRRQMKVLGIATKDDLAVLEARFAKQLKQVKQGKAADKPARAKKKSVAPKQAAKSAKSGGATKPSTKAAKAAAAAS